jgi:hypothetical protein
VQGRVASEAFIQLQSFAREVALTSVRGLGGPPEGARVAAPRGLATLALLKARYDEGKDHLSLFEPFVNDAAAVLNAEAFPASEVRDTIQRIHGLTLPVDTVQTVLGRLVRKGLLRREGGRYFKEGGFRPPVGLAADIQTIESQQRELAAALSNFARTAGQPFLDEAEALSELLAFIAAYDVPLLLSNPQPLTLPADDAPPSRRSRMIARFIQQECLASPLLAEALSRLLEGYVLQNLLFLKDIVSVDQQFLNVLLLLDAPIAFALLDLTGSSSALAAKEGLQLLKATGVNPQILDKTVDEMKRVLAVHEHHLGTAQGRLLLHQTELTRCFISNRWTPSDVRSLSASLELRLERLGVVVRPSPKRDRRFTLDEVALSRLLSRDGKESSEPRVVHDIDCVAAVLMARNGTTANAVERCRALFSTTSGLVVRNVQRWYREQGQRGIPPIMHQVALTNIAWLKKPAAAGRLKLHELAALCGAMIRPSRRTWTAFLDNIRRLQDEGVLTTDEAVAIVASELTEPLLSTIDDDHDPDADSLTEVVERVRASYRADLEAAFEGERGLAASALDQAVSETLSITREHSILKARLDSRVVKIAHAIAQGVFIVGVVLLLVAVIVVLPGVLERVAGWLRTLSWIAIGLSTILTLYGALYGGHLRELRDRFEGVLASAVRRLIVGGEVTPASPGT